MSTKRKPKQLPYVHRTYLEARAVRSALKVAKRESDRELPEPDHINAPSHYIAGRKYEPIDVIEDWELPYNLGTVVKYVSRAGRKIVSSHLDDLLKAEFHLKREIARIHNSGRKEAP